MGGNSLGVRVWIKRAHTHTNLVGKSFNGEWLWLGAHEARMHVMRVSRSNMSRQNESTERESHITAVLGERVEL